MTEGGKFEFGSLVLQFASSSCSTVVTKLGRCSWPKQMVLEESMTLHPNLDGPTELHSNNCVHVQRSLCESWMAEANLTTVST